jgi:ComF family protein
VGKYDGALKEAIHRFKYDGVRILAEPFAKLMHDYLTNFADFPWRLANIVIPVPIHPIRQRIRGYNQSELLAERLSRTLGLPIVADAVIRHRYTPPQVSLPGDLRRVNVQGAFRVVKPLVVQNKIVLLVDDVATTCSTIHECSTAILSAGALAVFVVCLAFGA